MTENIPATTRTAHEFSIFRSPCDLRFWIRIENHYLEFWILILVRTVFQIHIQTFFNNSTMA